MKNTRCTVPGPLNLAMLRFATIVSLVTVIACKKSSSPGKSTYEVNGSSAERIAAVSALITKHRAPPTAIVDAHFLEEQIGDGGLGPSDFSGVLSHRGRAARPYAVDTHARASRGSCWV